MVSKKIEFLFDNIVQMGRPIPDNVFDYGYNNPGIGFFWRVKV